MQKIGGGGTPALLRSWGQAAPTAASAPASLMKFFFVVVGGKDFRSAQTAFGLLFGLNTMTRGDGDGGGHVERTKRGIGMMLQLQ